MNKSILYTLNLIIIGVTFATIMSGTLTEGLYFLTGLLTASFTIALNDFGRKK